MNALRIAAMLLGGLAACGSSGAGLGGAAAGGEGATGGEATGGDGPTGGNGAGGSTEGLSIGFDGVQAFDAEVADNAEANARIRQARVFFGHQSIGANTLEGMAALGFAAPWVHWDFPESADYNGGAYFGQEYVGQNGDPKGKAAAFRSFMIDAGYGGRVEIAGMKVCFVDFDDDGAGPAVGDAAEMQALEQAYAAAVSDVREAYPSVRLFHVTPPLVAADYWSVSRNGARVELGDWIQATYGGVDVVFDLQDVESTDPRDGAALRRGGAVGAVRRQRRGGRRAPLAGGLGARRQGVLGDARAHHPRVKACASAPPARLLSRRQHPPRRR